MNFRTALLPLLVAFFGCAGQPALTVVMPSIVDPPPAPAPDRCGVGADVAGACYLGNPGVCYAFGERASAEASLVPSCFNVARSAWARGCDLGDGASCGRVCDSYHDQSRSSAAERACERAREVDEAACYNASNAEACIRLSERLTALRRHHDAARARAQACLLGAACVQRHSAARR